MRTKDDFLREIRRERRRALETGQPFLVAVLPSPPGAEATRALHVDMGLLLKPGSEQRVTVGPVDRRRLGVLCRWPDDEARRTLARVCRDAPLGSGCGLFAFPIPGTPSLVGDGGKGDDGKGDDGKGEETARPVLDLALLADPMPWWKRTIDVLGALAALVLLAPLLLMVALIVKVGSPGPVFFRQERVGLWGTTFRIWKFRTMHVSADAEAHRRYVQSLREGDGRLEKMDGEYALVPLGGWLRTLALDELPQLFNVLQGEMSLVGPRPDVLAFDDYEPWQRLRFHVTPGMTGLWQVSGKNETTFDEMIWLDLEYIRRRSLWTDLTILLRTAPVLLAQVRMLIARRQLAPLPLTPAIEEPEVL